ENCSRNPRRQRDHAHHPALGRAEDRVLPRRPQLGHRAHEAQVAAQQPGHGSRLQGRRQDGPDRAGEEGLHLLLLRRPDVRLDGLL
ncbi:MAG: Translation elongation factor P, partial [uncultured Ramlibacter sp.]